MGEREITRPGASRDRVPEFESKQCLIRGEYHTNSFLIPGCLHVRWGMMRILREALPFAGKMINDRSIGKV